MQTQRITCDIRPATTVAALLVLMLFFFQNGLCADHRTDSITMKSQNKPLEAVLNEIGQANGYTFIFGDEWKNTPVSVNFTDLSLDEALERILVNMNHAVIYDSPTAIRIVIYGMSSMDRSKHGISGRSPRHEPDVRDVPEETRGPDEEIVSDTPDNNNGDEGEEATDVPPPSEPAEEPVEASTEQAGQPE